MDFSVATRRNLARLDENRIDYDLLEELVAHIDGSYEEGAILVFLPGAAGVLPISSFCYPLAPGGNTQAWSL
jgi:hypothetical protein